MSEEEMEPAESAGREIAAWATKLYHECMANGQPPELFHVPWGTPTNIIRRLLQEQAKQSPSTLDADVQLTEWL